MEQALMEYILNALWQVPLMAGAAWLLVRMVKPGPRVEHLLWLAQLAMAVLLPAYGIARVAGPLPQVTTAITASGAQNEPLSAHSSAYEQPRLWQLFSAPHTLRVKAAWARWLVRLYLASVLLGLLRFARAWHRSRHLVAHSRPSLRHREALARYSRRMGVPIPQLRESVEVASPMILGAVSPVLLVPQGFERFTQQEIGAALCHELAHIQRRDYLVNLICQLSALPLVWHPVVDAVQQRIHMTREMICDAIAAAEMESKVGYAKCLLSMARSMLVTCSAGSEAQVLSLFGNHPLEERMMRLTETTRMRVRLQAVRIVAAATIMAATSVMAAMFHVTPAMAQASAPGTDPAAIPIPPVTPQTQETVTATEPVEPADKTLHGNQQRAAKMKPKLHSALIKKQIEDAQKQMADADKQVADAHKHIEDAQKQAFSAGAFLNSSQFKKQMEEAQKQASSADALLHSPQFHKQMEDAQRQASMAAAMLNSPQFKKQMEDAQRQISMTAAMLDSPRFKQQMEEARQQASKMKALFDNPEFKRRLEILEKEFQSGDMQPEVEAPPASP